MSDRARFAEDMVLDFDGWLGRQSEETRAGIQQHLNVVPDAGRPAAKQKLASMFALSDATGIDHEIVADRWDTFRTGFAEKQGGDWLAVKNDEAGFNGRLVQHYTKQRDERHLVQGPDEPLSPDAGEALAGERQKKVEESLLFHAQEAAFDGKTYADALATWQTNAAKKPGYDAARAGVYAEVAKKAHGELAAAVEKARPIALEAFNRIAAGRGIKGRMSDQPDDAPFALFRGLSPKEKDAAFAVMGRMMAGSKGLATKDRDFAFFEAAGRGFENLFIGGGTAAYRSRLLRGGFHEGDMVLSATGPEELKRRFVSEAVHRSGAHPPTFDYYEAKRMRALTAEEAKKWNGQLAEELEDVDTAEHLRKFGQDILDPAKTGGEFFRKYVLPVADSLALMTSMAIPASWAPAMELAASDYKNKEYMRLRDIGMNPIEADNLAGVTGFGQAALDKLSFMVLAKGLPNTTRALQKFALSGRGLSRFGANFAGTFGAETVIEVMQDHIIPAIVQDNLASDPKFDVRWEKVWRDAAKATPDIMRGMVILSALGGAAQTSAQSRFVEEFSASPAAMRARGYSLEQIAEIQAVPMEARGGLLAQYLPEKAPRGEEREKLVSEAVAMARKEAEAFAAKQKEELAATKEAAAAGVRVVRVVRNAGGWQVTQADGATVTVDTAEAARRIREDLRQARSEEEAKALVRIVDNWHAKAPEGTSRETVLTGETVRSDGKSVTRERDGEIVAEVRNAEDLEAIRQEAGMDGASEIDVLINGANRVEFAESVGNAAKATVQRLELNQSESTALTAIHEQVEATWKTGIARGTITLEETHRAIAAVAGQFDPAAARNPEEKAFRERLQRVAAKKATETEIRETVSELAVADVIGRRKDGSVMPAGSISATMDAAMINATDPADVKAVGTFRAMLRGLRRWMRAVFGTVAALRKNRREGKSADFDKLVNKLLGLEQAEHERAAAEEAEGIAREGGLDYTPPSAEEEADGVAFSVSPASRVELVSKRLDEAFAKSPEKRQELVKQAKLKLKALASKWGDESFLSEQRTPESLDRQQRVVEAFRREELEAQVYTQHAAVFSNPDMGKLWSGPIMSALAKPGTFLSGRLKSQSAAMRSPNYDAKQGEYDGAEGIPRVVFGGELNPTDAAEEIFGQGSTADMLWDAIRKEVASVERWKEFQKAAKEDLKRARNEAHEEAFEWRRQQDQRQSKEWNPKERLVRDLQTYNAVLMVLPPVIRGKAGGFVKLAQLGDKGRLAEMEARFDKIDRLLEDYLRKEYDAALDALFERAKPAKDAAGKKRVGKAGADIHALFDTLRAARDWDAPTADAHIAALEARLATGEMTPAEEAHALQEIGLVQLVADWKRADAERRASAVENATRVFNYAYADFQMNRAMQAAARQARREALRADTGKSGTKAERDEKALADNGLKGTWKDAILSMLQFEGALKWVFGNNSVEAQRIVDLEREASFKATDEVQAMETALDDLFATLAGGNYKGSKLRWKLAQKSMTAGGISLSEMEAITATLMWRQEDGRRHMEGNRDENGHPASAWHYDQSFIDEIETQLSPEGKAVRAHLIASYGSEYASLNAVYRSLNNIDLPQNSNYAPLTVKPQQAQSGQSIDPVTGSTFSSGSTTPGSLRSRGGKVAEPDFLDAAQVFIAHKKQMAHWKAYAPVIAEAQPLLGNREVGNSVDAVAGNEATRVIRGWLDYFAQGGTRDAAAHLALNQGLSRMTGRAASIGIVGRISTVAIQSTQLAAATAEMPMGSYLKRLGLLLTGNLGWGKALASPYIQRRVQQMPPLVRAAMEGLKAQKPGLLRHAVQKLGLLIPGADGLFTAGTFAMVYDYQLSQAKRMGLSGAEAEAHALTAAERITDRVAQPTRPGARSLYENTATNPIVRVVWAFASESRKQMGLLLYSLAKRPAVEKLRAFNYVLIYGTLLASMIRAAMRDVQDEGEDDEVFDERNWSVKRLALSMATDPLHGVPVFGGMAQNYIFKGAGEYRASGTLLSNGERAVKPLMRLDELVTGELEAREAIRDVELILSGLGLFNSDLAAAASLAHLADDLFGMAQNAKPE